MQQPKTAQKWFSLLLLFGMLFSLIQPTAALAQDPEPPASITVDPGVLQEINADGSASYWVEFRSDTRLASVKEMSWKERGWYVYNQLTEQATQTQRNVVDYLKSSGVKYQSYWINNTILVHSSNLTTLNGLLSFAEIKAINPRKSYILYEPDRSAAVTDNQIMAVEPNLTHIDVDDAWALGYTGEGLVVANIDTGVRYSHQALVNQYRGNAGGTFDHNYNWFDPDNLIGVPYDGHGHGTHTMGTIVGDDGGSNQIGVAPGADWIACAGCPNGSCTDTALLGCAQWIAAPTDTSGNTPDPSLRPNVVNNSWGDCGTSYDPWYQAVVDAWHLAGIYPVFSNGNASNCGYSSPPGLNTVGNPARYGNVTGVGSSGEQDGLYATHSNWGPTDNPDTVNAVPGFASMKPQVIAPGVSIRSSTPGSDTEYQDGWSGTSMSAPHVTGLMALIWQAAPCLIGDYATTETLIEETANPVVYDDGSPDTPTNDPNYAAGWGEIDALAAVQAAAGMCGDSILDGTVTDATTSTPIQGARVEFSGAGSRIVYTDADGYYSVNVFAGVYDIAVSKFGYDPVSASGIVAGSGATTTTNFQLTGLAAAMLSGVVYDGGVEGGAHHGYPLYASLTFSAPGFSQTIYSDPFSGEYAIELYLGQAYDVTVQAVPSGYEPYTGTLTTDSNPDSQDFYLYVPAASCAAPGYQPEYDLFWNFESDTGGFTPGGTTSFAWGDFTSGPGEGHSGAKGLATNPAGNYNAYEEGYITSPPVDLTGYGSSSPVLEWWDWKEIESQTYDWARLDVTRDGGVTWDTAWGPVGGVYDTVYSKQSVVLDPTYNVANFQFRFYFHSDISLQYAGWYVDDIGIFGYAVPPTTVVWTEDFETGNGSFTHAGTADEWEWGLPTTVFPGGCADGTHCWDTDLDSNYEDYASYYLQSPAIDLSGVVLPPDAHLYFKWDQAIHIESASYDHATAQYSTDGSTWNTMWDHTGGTLTENWNQKSFDITSAAGGTVWFRFVVSSDGSVTYEGWTLDGFEISYQQAYEVPAPECTRIPGGVVAGYTYDENTSAPLTGATVTSDTGAATETFAVPDDPLEGFYWMFQPLGSGSLTGQASRWTPAAVSGSSTNAAITIHSSSAGPARPDSTPAPQADVLWDQPLSAVNQGAYVDQEFPDVPTASAFLADDFINADNWEIATFYVPGDLWNGGTSLFNATALNFMIYADAGGVPAGDPSGGGATPLWALSLPPTNPQITISTGSGGYPSNTSLTLTTPVQLPAGHYWFIFYPSMSFATGGQFGRQPSDTTNGYIGQIVNPGGYFGIGTTWQNWTNLGMTQQDIAFRLEGSVIPIEEDHVFTASMTDYADDVETVTVLSNAVTRQDFYLGAGSLAFDPLALEKTMTMGDAPATETLTISNTGTADAIFELMERERGFTPLNIPAFTGGFPASSLPSSIGRAPETQVRPLSSAGLFNHLLAGEPAFAVNLLDDTLYSIPDTTTPGVWNVIGLTAATLYSGDFVAGDFTTLYVISANDHNLYRVDTTSGAATAIGPTTPPTGETFTGLTGTPYGELYGLSTTCSNSSLMMIDPASGATTVLGALPGITCGIDLAYNTDDDLIYIVDINTDSLFQVDPVTLAVTSVGPVGIDASYAQGLDFEEDSGILYWAAYSVAAGGELRVIDTSTGASALVGAFPGGAEVDSFAFATGGASDVPWLYEDPVTGSVPAGSSTDITVTFDPGALLQPGEYEAQLRVLHDTPYSYPNIPVTLHLQAPANWGAFNGTVSGMERCDVNPALLDDATINFYSASVMVASTTTDADGYYSWSLEEGTYDIEVIADGYISQMVYNYPVAGGETVTVNFDLRLDAPCLVVDPTSLEQYLYPDATASQTLSLTNLGAADVDFDLLEFEAQVSVTAEIELIIDDGASENNIGIGGTQEFIFLNRFTPAADDFPFTLDEIQVYFASDGLVNVGDDMVLVVYENTSGNATDPAVGSNFLASFPVTVQAVNAWNSFTLPGGVDLDGPGDVLIGVIAMEVPGTSYWPAALDQTVSQGRSWAGWWSSSPPPAVPTLPPDSDWTLIDVYFPGNWMIRGMGSSAETDIFWLSEDPVLGSVPADSSLDVNVAFNSTGLALGDYFATLRVLNAPDPSINIPTTLHVVDNPPPVANDQAVTTTEDTPVNIALGANDPYGDDLTWIVVDAPDHGGLSGTAPNLTYTPDADFNGADSFTFKVNDGTYDSNVATVAITVTPVNDAPLAVGDTYAVDEDAVLSVGAAAGVLGNDSDPDADPLTAMLVDDVLHGTLALAANGSFVYTPEADFFGSDSFTYQAFDGEAYSNVTTVTITVSDQSDVKLIFLPQIFCH